MSTTLAPNGTITWFPVDEYQNIGSGVGTDPEPLVLLWEENTGVAVGKVLRFTDGDIFTIANGYHGFKFTKFAYINTPE